MQFGPADTAALVERWRTAFPDVGWDVHAVVADGDRAAAHLSLTGTHRGIWQGLEPTGRAVTFEHMFFVRFENDRIAEMWEVYDPATLTAQLSGQGASPG